MEVNRGRSGTFAGISRRHFTARGSDGKFQASSWERRPGVHAGLEAGTAILTVR